MASSQNNKSSNPAETASLYDPNGEYAKHLLASIDTNLKACEKMTAQLCRTKLRDIEIVSCMKTMCGLLCNSQKCSRRYHQLCRTEYGRSNWRPGVQSLNRAGPGLYRLYEALSLGAAHLAKSLPINPKTASRLSNTFAEAETWDDCSENSPGDMINDAWEIITIKPDQTSSNTDTVVNDEEASLSGEWVACDTEEDSGIGETDDPLVKALRAIRDQCVSELESKGFELDRSKIDAEYNRWQDAAKREKV